MSTTVRSSAGRREQTREEEIANSVSHGVGLLGALVAGPFLIADALRYESGAVAFGAAVFVASMALLYFGSAMYHALPSGRAKHLFHLSERSAIFVLIAGTYTPVTLSVFEGAWVPILLGSVWGLAVLGIAITIIGRASHRKTALLLYLAMGWLVVIAIRPLWVALPLSGFLWLLAGGAAYTVGVGFYAANHVRYTHFIWHLFVLAGTACHFIAIRFYVL